MFKKANGPSRTQIVRKAKYHSLIYNLQDLSKLVLDFLKDYPDLAELFRDVIEPYRRKAIRNYLKVVHYYRFQKRWRHSKG